MAERYSRLYSLPENLHAPGAPFLIAAGVLLRDAHSEEIGATLKLQNISDKTISALTLTIVGLDSAGRELCRAAYSYHGLEAARDDCFGMRELIELPQPGVRSFVVQAGELVFSDGESWNGEGLDWMPLPAQESLNTRLFDTEIVRQYRIETTEQSRFVPLDAGELWLCACGAVNRKGEACHVCGQTLEHCSGILNIELLRANKALRLNAEAMQASIEEARRNSRSVFFRRLLYVLVPLLLIAAAATGFYFYRERQSRRYEQAVALFEIGDYTGAVQLFDKLKDYRDAADYARRARQTDALLASYTRAVKLLENGRWDDARSAFEELRDYENSAQLALEARYRKGQELIAQGAFEEAREIFLSLGSYSDCPEIAAHFFERLVSEQTSLNEECGGPLTTTYRYDPQGRIAERTEHFSEYEGMSDRVYAYQYNDDGGWTVTENQVPLRYDAEGNLLGQGGHLSYTYQYTYYDDGTIHQSAKMDAESGALISGIAYDTHGNPEQVLNADGRRITVRNEYEGDLLTKQESYDENGSMLTRKSFEYDEQGRLRRTSFLTPGAAAAVTESCSYGIVYVPESDD